VTPLNSSIIANTRGRRGASSEKPAKNRLGETEAATPTPRKQALLPAIQRNKTGTVGSVAAGRGVPSGVAAASECPVEKVGSPAAGPVPGLTPGVVTPRRPMPQQFSVWAPVPERVELVLEGRRLPMERGQRGWWSTSVENAGQGTRYGFSLDRGPTRPDPRSASQPDGIDGLSAVVDHDSFDWHDASWRGVDLAGSVLYELHVGTFSDEGTFAAAAEHLGHLVELGVGAVEVMPVAEFSGDRGWGYDGVDLFAPHHAYGGPDGLKGFVDACHGAGLGVVIDVVYNHLGPAGNYLAEFGPYFSERHRTNWGAAVNFDGPGSDEVRRFVLDNATMWLRDYHADGLRLDAVHAIVDDSALHILEQLADDVDALAAHVGRPLFLIAESDRNDPRVVRGRETGGLGMDAAWADEWHHALHAALSGERSGYYEDFGSLAMLAKALRQAWVYDGQWSPHRGRTHGRPPTGLSGRQFVVSVQNHDQIGNRAAGDRLGALVSPGRLRIAAALLLTGPFTPMLFEGEEWGASTPFLYFTDHRDPQLAAAVSEGRRHEFVSFGWDPGEVPDPQSCATFEASKLRWAETSAPRHAGLLSWYRELVALRRRLPQLSDPRLAHVEASADEECSTLRMRRRGGGGESWGACDLEVLVNLAAEPRTFPVDEPFSLVAASEEAFVSAGSIRLAPDAVAIVTVGPAR
jgi:maltooligosyltrehalose trehalohydrolase